MMLLPAIVDKALGGGKVMVSLVMAANGLGALVGSLAVASMRTSSRSLRLIPRGLLAMAIFLIGFSLSRTFAITMVFSVLCGVALLTTMSLTNTSIQMNTPARLRGRVMALFVMAFMGIMPVSAIIFGSIGQAIGPTNAVLGGAIVLAMWAIFLLARPNVLAPSEPTTPTAPAVRTEK
jgi:MFS family permease